jgi:hypothetical protein
VVMWCCREIRPVRDSVAHTDWQGRIRESFVVAVAAAVRSKASDTAAAICDGDAACAPSSSPRARRRQVTATTTVDVDGRRKGCDDGWLKYEKKGISPIAIPKRATRVYHEDSLRNRELARVKE